MNDVCAFLKKRGPTIFTKGHNKEMAKCDPKSSQRCSPFDQGAEGDAEVSERDVEIFLSNGEIRSLAIGNRLTVRIIEDGRIKWAVCGIYEILDAGGDAIGKSDVEAAQPRHRFTGTSLPRRTVLRHFLWRAHPSSSPPSHLV